MDIKIGAVDMLRVLVHAGIDATDAKAIIFDLLQYPDGNIPERVKLKEAKTKRLKKRIVEVEEDDEDEDEDNEDDDEDDNETVEYENSEQTEDDLLATKIRKPKRINFKGFGGAGLTPISGK